MGKSYRHSHKGYHDSDDSEDRGSRAIFVNLKEVFISESTVQKLLSRDGGQIEKMRVDYEDGREMVRCVLRHRAGGGYNVEDGRHRVIAAKLAGVCFIEALVVG
ncbi:MAG: hypothetical protein IT342_18435 [Candidatus Melainabacteria bacterium]|nr:hypothetical protein [Candidatus Melainabacteria bacterium]